MTTILHEVTNSEDGMTACVFASHGGGFGVSLRDDDSGEYVQMAIHGYKTIDAAISKAHQVVRNEL